MSSQPIAILTGDDSSASLRNAHTGAAERSGQSRTAPIRSSTEFQSNVGGGNAFVSTKAGKLHPGTDWAHSSAPPPSMQFSQNNVAEHTASPAQSERPASRLSSSLPSKSVGLPPTWEEFVSEHYKSASAVKRARRRSKGKSRSMSHSSLPAPSFDAVDEASTSVDLATSRERTRNSHEPDTSGGVSPRAEHLPTFGSSPPQRATTRSSSFSHFTPVASSTSTPASASSSSSSSMTSTGSPSSARQRLSRRASAKYESGVAYTSPRSPPSSGARAPSPLAADMPRATSPLSIQAAATASVFTPHPLLVSASPPRRSHSQARLSSSLPASGALMVQVHPFSSATFGGGVHAPRAMLMRRASNTRVHGVARSRRLSQRLSSHPATLDDGLTPAERAARERWNTETMSLVQLPPTWMEIFLPMLGPRELANLGATCKAFQPYADKHSRWRIQARQGGVARRALRRLLGRSDPTVLQLRDFLQRRGTVRRLRIEDARDELVEALDGFALLEVDCSYSDRLYSADGLSGVTRKVLLRQCADLQDVTALANVRHVDLSGCWSLSDVSALGNVRWLNLQATGVDDVSALGNVHWLNLSYTSVSDVSALHSVHTLILNDCPLLFDVSALTNVTELHLQQSNVTDVSALGKCRSLDLSLCGDLVNLDGLGGVHTLYLYSDLNVHDLRPIRGVHTVNVAACMQLIDVSALDRCKRVDLSECVSVVDFSPLRACESLDLSYTHISDVSALGNVRELDLTDCMSVTDVSALQNVETLILYGCVGVSDVTKLSRVQYLDVRHTQVSDLRGCAALKRCVYFKNQIEPSKRGVLDTSHALGAADDGDAEDAGGADEVEHHILE